MKIQIEVEAVTEKCAECPNFEVKTLHLGKSTLHICKNVPVCRHMIELWEETRKEEEQL